MNTTQSATSRWRSTMRSCITRREAMAADLHIHALVPPMTEDTLKKFFRNTLGSKYFNPIPVSEDRMTAYSLVSDTPHIHVGEVSWLKAAVLDDPETFIPAVVGQIAEIIAEDLPVVDDALIAKIKGAYAIGNKTGYDVAPANAVLDWLEKHRGQRVFTVSW